MLTIFGFAICSISKYSFENKIFNKLLMARSKEVGLFKECDKRKHPLLK